jgi:hypothetical protein
VIRAAAILAALLGLAAGQSFFNARALGEPAGPAEARIVGVGGPAALSWLNPGILVDLDQTAFGLSVLGNGTIGGSPSGNRFIGTARPAGFHAAVPLPLNTRLRLGLDERFNQDFDTWADSAPGQTWRYQVTGRGGIYSLRAGLAWSFLGVGCIGVEYGRLVGAAREDWRFQVPGGYESTDTLEIDYFGNTVKAGFAGQTERFSLAASFTPGYELTARSLKKVHGVVEDSVRTSHVGLPWRVDVGAGVNLLERLDLVFGAEYRPWSGMTLNDTLPGWGTRDAWRFSGAAEIGLTDRHPLRVGYSYTDWYYGAVDPDGGTTPVTAHALHLGTSLPIPSFGSIDIGTELARRSGGGLTEYAGRLMLTLSYREAWERRTRRWGY